MGEGFRNPVAGSGGALVRTSLHSPGYVAGTSGWSINQDGSADLNDVSVRGDLVVESGVHRARVLASLPITYAINPGSPWFHDGGVTAFDFLGLHDQAYLSLSSPRLIGSPTSDAAELQLWSAAGSPGIESVIIASASRQVGAVMVGGSAWVPLPLSAGYSARPGTWQPAYTWAAPTTIRLRGAINKGAGTGGAGANGYSDGDSPFTCPVAPASITTAAATCQTRAGNYGTCFLAMSAAGVVTFRTNAASDPGFVSLDGWMLDIT